MIDCGFAQSGDVCDPVNTDPFPYNPADIDAIFFTHAHADHIGLFPKLVRDGFHGPAYATEPTADLIPIMLEDAVSHLAHDADRCGHEPAYLRTDLERAYALIRRTRYHEPITVGDARVTFFDAGHILGSATVLVEVEGKRILFTGDLGRRTPAIVSPREIVPNVDVLVTESVYGNRLHGDPEAADIVLQDAVRETVKRRGVLLIPAFSLERTQIILASLDRMTDQGTIPDVPLYLDSPLAARISEVYMRYPKYLSPTLRRAVEDGKDPLAARTLKVTINTEESAAIDSVKPPKIIIAGAGMSHGGRIRHHERIYLGSPDTHLLFVGYQVPGSLGRRLRDGQKTVMIDKARVSVRAKIGIADGYSAHADRDDLMAYVEETGPKRVFVVLGETEAATFLAQRITGFLGTPVDVPREGEVYEI